MLALTLPLDSWPSPYTIGKVTEAERLEAEAQEAERMFEESSKASDTSKSPNKAGLKQRKGKGGKVQAQRYRRHEPSPRAGDVTHVILPPPS